LSFKLTPILNTPALENAHNQFMLAIYANVFRDAPEPGIASWVSSTDKPSTTIKSNTGDEAEKRLKHEVMQLSRRERKRLKTVHQGDIYDPFTQEMQDLGDVRRIKQPETGPAGAGGFQTKTSMLGLCPLSPLLVGKDALLTCVNRLGPGDPQTLYVPPLC
jgi:transcriptional coactivator HFI1/ADA1